MIFLLTVPRRSFFCGSFLLFILHVCLYYIVLSAPVTCRERADLLALLCLIFPCVFVTSHIVSRGQMWDLIVSIPDICLLFFIPCNTITFSNAIYSCMLANKRKISTMRVPKLFIQGGSSVQNIFSYLLQATQQSTAQKTGLGKNTRNMAENGLTTATVSIFR